MGKPITRADLPEAWKPLAQDDGPEIVISGPMWRVLRAELPDQHGVLRREYLIEVTGPKDKDLLGVQRWHELTSKSAMVEWVTVARHFLDELLKAAGETPDANHSQGR